VALDVQPRFISFDCYGTLIKFDMDTVMAQVLGDRLPTAVAPAFFTLAEAFRMDEVLGEYKPYRQVIRDATRRAARRFGLDYRDEDGDRIYAAIGTWGPHPGVTRALNALAERWPLVILSNAADNQIADNVANLAAPFHAVLTAEQSRAYKPRMAAFEYMLERLGCAMDQIVHVSSSPRYDLIPAHEIGFPHLVLLDRGYEPPQTWVGYHTIHDLAELPTLLRG
jgi:2-haloacid dehalogenase